MWHALLALAGVAGVAGAAPANRSELRPAALHPGGAALQLKQDRLHPGNALCLGWTGKTCSEDVWCGEELGETHCIQGRCMCQPDHCADAEGKCIAGNAADWISGLYTIKFMEPAQPSEPYIGAVRPTLEENVTAGDHTVVGVLASTADAEPQWRIAMGADGNVQLQNTKLGTDNLLIIYNNRRRGGMRKKEKKKTLMADDEDEEFVANMKSANAFLQAQLRPRSELTVSEASPFYNGHYYAAGSMNGHTLYKNDNGAVIYFEDGLWKATRRGSTSDRYEYYKRDPFDYYGAPPEGSWDSDRRGKFIVEAPYRESAAGTKFVDSDPDLLPLLVQLEGISPSEANFRFHRVFRFGVGLEVWHPTTETALASSNKLDWMFRTADKVVRHGIGECASPKVGYAEVGCAGYQKVVFEPGLSPAVIAAGPHVTWADMLYVGSLFLCLFVFDQWFHAQKHMQAEEPAGS